MKYCIPALLAGIVSFLFHGCGDHTASSVRDQQDHYELEIYDSIPFQFNYQDVRLTDQWRNEWYLGVNRTQPYEMH